MEEVFGWTSTGQSTTMCTSTRLYYSCGDEATKPFRVGVCIIPCSPACEVKSRTIRLPWNCPKCFWRQQSDTPETPAQSTLSTSDFKDGGGPSFSEMFWHIPSRCFMDPGFQRLDPFAADRIKQQLGAEEKTWMSKHGHHSVAALRHFFHDWKRRSELRNKLDAMAAPSRGACCERKRMFGLDLWISKNRLFDDRCTSSF